MSCLKLAIKIGSRNFTVIRHENKAFQKPALSRQNLKTLALRLSRTGNILKTKPFENDDYDIITIFPCPRNYCRFLSQ